MQIKKKLSDSLIFDGKTGQVTTKSLPEPPPEDIPSIVERYIGLVGRVIGDLETKHRALDAGATLESRDINAIVSMGRTIAMLQAVEEAKISRIGGKAVKEFSTSQLRQLVEASNQSAKDEETSK